MTHHARDGWLLAVGTFTRLPVPMPSAVDTQVAGRAMTVAPLVGSMLFAATGLPLVLAPWMAAWAHAEGRPLPAAVGLLAAVLTVALTAWATRALHLDGLADTSDALGGGRSPERVLAIARASDIGPFGVVTLVLALLLQVAGLSVVMDSAGAAGQVPVGTAWVAWTFAGVASRMVAMCACMRTRATRLRAARPDGLGALVAHSVSRTAVVVWLVILATATILIWHRAGATVGVVVTCATLCALAAGAAMIWTAARRFAGITGDVLGAGIELATTAALIAGAGAAVAIIAFSTM